MPACVFQCLNRQTDFSGVLSIKHPGASAENLAAYLNSTFKQF